MEPIVMPLPVRCRAVLERLATELTETEQRAARLIASGQADRALLELQSVISIWPARSESHIEHSDCWRARGPYGEFEASGRPVRWGSARRGMSAAHLSVLTDGSSSAQHRHAHRKGASQ
jgi:hypothetical protein